MLGEQLKIIDDIIGGIQDYRSAVERDRKMLLQTNDCQEPDPEGERADESYDDRFAGRRMSKAEWWEDCLEGLDGWVKAGLFESYFYDGSSAWDEFVMSVYTEGELVEIGPSSDTLMRLEGDMWDLFTDLFEDFTLSFTWDDYGQEQRAASDLRKHLKKVDEVLGDLMEIRSKWENEASKSKMDMGGGENTRTLKYRSKGELDGMRAAMEYASHSRSSVPAVRTDSINWQMAKMEMENVAARIPPVSQTRGVPSMQNIPRSEHEITWTFNKWVKPKSRRGPILSYVFRLPDQIETVLDFGDWMFSTPPSESHLDLIAGEWESLLHKIGGDAEVRRVHMDAKGFGGTVHYIVKQQSYIDYSIAIAHYKHLARVFDAFLNGIADILES